MKHKFIVLAVSPVLLSLAACGGGGGGGGTSATLGGFTSWSAVRAPSTTTVSGIGQELSYTANDEAVTDVDRPSATIPVSITQQINEAGEFTRFSATTPSGAVINIDTSQGDLIVNLAQLGQPGINGAVSADGTVLALAVVPEYFGWDYQSFGVWLTGIGVGRGTAGVASIGAVTPVSAVPTQGSATYMGAFGGVYVNANGLDYLAAGDLSATVDFGSRTVSLTGSNSEITPDFSQFTSAPNLNFSGTASYSSGSNQFEGNLATAGSLAGTTTGQFYGPTAEELGGVAILRDSEGGIESFGFSYGAAR